MKIVRDLGTLTFQLQNTPPQNENCQGSWHFDFSVTEYPLPPKNENCQGSWHFDFSVTEYPPKMKIVRDLGTLTFQLQNTPPQNENCQGSWHFDFSVTEYPLPPPPKWKLSGILALWLFSYRIPPPSPPNMKIVRDLGTLTFQLQNTPPPQKKNENCQGSWHFDFSVTEYPPPPPPKMKFRQIFPMGNYVWQVTTCGDFIQPG